MRIVANPENTTIPVSRETRRVGVVAGGDVVVSCVRVSVTVSGIVVEVGVGKDVIVSLTGLSVGVIIIGPGAFLE